MRLTIGVLTALGFIRDLPLALHAENHWTLLRKACRETRSPLKTTGLNWCPSTSLGQAVAVSVYSLNLSLEINTFWKSILSEITETSLAQGPPSRKWAGGKILPDVTTDALNQRDKNQMEETLNKIIFAYKCTKCHYQVTGFSPLSHYNSDH